MNEDLNRMVIDSERTIGRLRGATAELESVVGTAESKDGLVRARVDYSGRLLDVTLDPRAMRHDSRSLAEVVTLAVQRAQDDASRQGQELMTGVLGDAGPPPFDLDKLREELATAQDAFARSLGEHSDRIKNIP